MSTSTLPRRARSHPLRAFLYARASRDPKKRATATADQLAEMRRECEENEWQNVGEFVDNNRSASRHAKRARDDYEEMVRRVKAGEADIIVAWESSRLQRDLEVYVRLRNLCFEAGCLLSYNGTVYDMSKRSDRKVTALAAIQDEDEAEAIRDRNLRTVRLNAQKGRPHGRILYGYTRRYDPTNGALLDQIPHPENAAVVRRIFAEFVGGLTVYRIAKGLREEGIRTGTGAEWSDVSVHAVLKKASYAGRRIFRGQDIGPADWPALVDDLTWQSAQRILKDPQRRAMRDTAVVHRLSGLGTCGVCTAPFMGTYSGGYPSYICDGKFCAAIRIATLEAYVDERMVTWLEKPESAAAFRDESLAAEVEEALAELEALTTELKAAQAAAKQGVLSVASLIAVEAGLLPRISKAEALSERFAGASTTLEGLLGQPDADERWDALEMVQQRAVLREVATIVLHPARARGDSSLYPGRIIMTLGPKG
jgi:DNA invertase Pin-like site-specific DNA recombinase